MNREPKQQRHFAKRIASAVVGFSLVACMGLLSACAPTSPQEEQAVPPTPAEYLVNMNSYASDLSSKLSDLSDAVNEGRFAMLATKLQAASEVMDKMTSLEAPDAMGDVKEAYDSAVDDLKAALSGYVDLFTEVEGASSNGTYTASNYDSRLEELQKLYDQGLNELEEADKKAAEL